MNTQIFEYPKTRRVYTEWMTDYSRTMDFDNDYRLSIHLSHKLTVEIDPDSQPAPIPAAKETWNLIIVPLEQRDGEWKYLKTIKRFSSGFALSIEESILKRQKDLSEWLSAFDVALSTLEVLLPNIINEPHRTNQQFRIVTRTTWTRSLQQNNEAELFAHLDHITVQKYEICRGTEDENVPPKISTLYKLRGNLKTTIETSFVLDRKVTPPCGKAFVRTLAEQAGAQTSIDPNEIEVLFVILLSDSDSVEG